MRWDEMGWVGWTGWGCCGWELMVDNYRCTVVSLEHNPEGGGVQISY